MSKKASSKSDGGTEGETGRRRILFIDDNPDLTQALQVAIELRARGALSITTYNDPVEAIRSFKRGDYDLVLLDYHMPRMNGFEVCRELRRIDNSVKVCLLTASDIRGSEFATMLYDVKVQALIRKPATLGTIMTMLNEFVPPVQKKEAE